jgi:hypothetical protein
VSDARFQLSSAEDSPFSWKDSAFSVHRSKLSTARVRYFGRAAVRDGCSRVATQVVLRRELNIVNSFTIEASFMGANTGKGRGAWRCPDV